MEPTNFILIDMTAVHLRLNIFRPSRKHCIAYVSGLFLPVEFRVSLSVSNDCDEFREKTADSIEMPFTMEDRVGPRDCVGGIWQIRLNDCARAADISGSAGDGDAASFQIALGNLVIHSYTRSTT